MRGIENRQRRATGSEKARLKRIFEENSFINPSLKEATFENFESNEFRQALQKQNAMLRNLT